MQHLDDARVLADVLDDHGFTAESLLSLSDPSWQLAVSLIHKLTGRKLDAPNDAVKTLVFTRLQERERLATVHPLAGIGFNS